MEENYIIDLENVTVRFNMATEKIDNLKEYFVKLVKRQLMFEEFLALKNITLQIRPGEAWGLVGTNGAGKSTMLKLISGILTPYKGTVTVNGTIAPLIELGAGFDMELTARENIFLNGTLLGHSRSSWKNILMRLWTSQNCGISWMCRLKIILPVCRPASVFQLRRWCARIF